jgi:hypothetical protein
VDVKVCLKEVRELVLNKVNGTECSETVVYKIQTPGNYPEDSTQHSEHGEDLKLRISYAFNPSIPASGNYTDANTCKGSVNLKSFRLRQLSELNLQRYFQVMYECIFSNFVLRSSYVTRYQYVPHGRSTSCSRKKSKAVRECQKVADPYNKQSIRTELACLVSVKTCSGKVPPYFLVYSRNRDGNNLEVSGN